MLRESMAGALHDGIRPNTSERNDQVERGGRRSLVSPTLDLCGFAGRPAAGGGSGRSPQGRGRGSSFGKGAGGAQAATQGRWVWGASLRLPGSATRAVVIFHMTSGTTCRRR